MEQRGGKEQVQAGVEAGVMGVCVSGEQDWICRVRGGPGQRQQKRQRGRQHAGLAVVPWLSPGPRNLWVPGKCLSDAPTDPMTHPEAAEGQAQPFCPIQPTLGSGLGSPSSGSSGC